MLPVTAWKSQKQEHEAVDPTVRGQKEERGHWCPDDFFSIQPRPSTHGTVLPTFKVDCPASPNPI